MSKLFATFSILSLLYGVLVLVESQSAVHEIEAGVVFVIFVLCLGFSTMAKAAKENGENQRKMIELLSKMSGNIVKNGQVCEPKEFLFTGETSEAE